MKISSIKTKNYSVIIGKNSLHLLSKKIKKLCPKAKNIALIIDKKIPKKFVIKIKKNLKKYKIYIIYVSSSEKVKNLNKVNFIINKLLSLNFNRSDIIIGLGGGIIGDMTGFLCSVYKRGINFINVPSTLLAQVDSCIGGKTGVNSNYGKNLIGSFYNPRLVITDIELLNSLPKREIICGYAEILKHSLIKDKFFFNFLQNNTKKFLSLHSEILLKGIKKSCEIKLEFTEKDFKEKGLRMSLNFGHTFAHALEAKNKYSDKLNHGEAVLIGMMIATKLSSLLKVCSFETQNKLINIYNNNSLLKNLNKFMKRKVILNSIKYMNNDKKKDDEKINLILLKKIGMTTVPGEYKYSPVQLEKIIKNLF